MTTHSAEIQPDIRLADITSPEVAPLVDGLRKVYEDLYGPNDEMDVYDADEFRPPNGCLLIATVAGKTVAGGGFRLLPGEPVAEIKRMWTDPDFRRQGLSRLILQELESRALMAGCERVRLETGTVQQAAVALYENAGYTIAENFSRYKDEPDSVCYEKILQP